MGYTNKRETDRLRIVYGDMALGVHGNNFDYLFSYQSGGLESLVIDGKEWLYPDAETGVLEGAYRQ